MKLKKLIIIAISCSVGAVLLCIVLYCLSYYAIIPCSVITKISITILGAFVAGIVTFIGLFFTVSFQDQQARFSEELKNCPLFVIEERDQPSALRQVNSSMNDVDIYDGEIGDNVRKINCDIKNVKNNYALNVLIKMNRSGKTLCIRNDQTIKLCLLSQEGGKILISFEDIYGIDYTQEIDYFYENQHFCFKYCYIQKEKK